MNFGLAKGWEWAGTTTKEEAFAIFDSFWKAGGNFFDTADKYHDGKSEEWIGAWIKERNVRDEIVLATKYSLPMKRGVVNHAGNHRKHMINAINASLKRLQTDFVDVYYVHFWDFTTPIEELMRSLNDLVRSGKVHHLGISDAPAWVVARANTIAELRGWNPFVCYQGRYSLLDRDLERDVMPMCKELAVSVIPWGAIGQGKLTGKYKRGENPAKSDAPRSTSNLHQELSHRDYDIADLVDTIAREVNATSSQIALAWCFRDSAIPTVLIGARTIQHLTDDIGALTVKLSDSQWKRLDEISKIDLGFPHNFIQTSYQTSPWLKEAGILV